MRDRLEKLALQRMKPWQKNSPRLSKLLLMDAYLEGTIYDCLQFEFDEESSSGGSFVKMQQKKPSVKFNLAKTTAKNIARKLFAGRHAPSLIHDSEDVVKKIKKLLKECKMNTEMIDLVTKGSIGSVCMTFKIVESDAGALRLTTNVLKAKDCYPEFDAAKQLKKLRVALEMDGQWFLNHGYTTDYKNEKINATKLYWYIKDLDKTQEVYFHAIPISKWNPITGDAECLKIIQEGLLKPTLHKLGLMPAQWFQNLCGGTFPDGDCLFEPGIDDIISYDYGMSQLDLGLKNAACPITVITGSLAVIRDTQGNPIPRSPSRVLQFEAERTDGEITEQAGKAEYLETNGQSFLAALAVYRQVKKDAHEQIHASRKDPDKVTTAMSGKGMDRVEEELGDMTFELRENYGDEGYLEIVKKMCLAAIKAKHKVMEGVTPAQIEELTLNWPDLHDESPQEYQARVAGIAQAKEADIIDDKQASDMHRAKTDVSDNLSGKKSKSQSTAKSVKDKKPKEDK